MLKKAISFTIMLMLAAMLAACDSGGSTAPTQVVQPTGTPLSVVSEPTTAPATLATSAPATSVSEASPTQVVDAFSTQTANAQPTTAVPGVTPSQGATSGEPRMIIETAKGRIVLKLFTDPSAGVLKTIANFTEKANKGYFDGLTFHRVENWVLQGGDPLGTGTGGGDMPSEYNQLPFVLGSLGVARGGDPAINNDSQFFIVKSAAEAAGLVGQYTNWGQVTEGMDVVNQIAIGDKMTKVRVEGVDLSALPTAVPAAEGKMTIETAKGKIVLKLRTDAAAGVSQTISNFTNKANNGYFDGLTFHRVENWVIQGGDPLGNGTGGGKMPSEYNQIPFTAGSLGVARGGDPAVNNDSQFFIVKTDSFHLNGQYTNWGQVVEGMDVVNKIAVGDKITKIRVEGVVTLKEPEHISVQHILIGFKDAVGFAGREVPEKAKTRTQEQAKVLAYDLLSRAKGGADFDQLVTEFTDDSPPGIYGMANTGVTPVGDEAQRQGMVAAFGDVGFALQVGEIGIADYDVQSSPFGFHIIKRVK
jgi:cyclophilin family peptidyl-prolyl cis-trans isomerase